MEFSIIIPVYNKRKHLERAINSVLNQTYQNFELILVDDSSTDGSYEYLESLKSDKIRLFRRDTPGPGGYSARNLGILKARSTWICFLDADDEWYLSYLKNIVRLRKKHINSEIVAFNWVTNESKEETISADEIIKKITLKDFLYNQRYIWTGSVSFSKKLLLRIGMFPEDGPFINGGDIDTWIRALYSSRESIHSSIVLACYYKDTVNRVTDYKKNPSYGFCSLNTLVQILRNTNDIQLRNLIKRFINRNVYNIQARQIRNGHRIKYSLLKKMYFNLYSMTRIGKLHIMYLLNIMKK